MLQFIYRVTGIMLLGVLGFLGIFLFEVLVPLVICFVIGAVVYQLIAGEEPTLSANVKPIRLVEGLGKWTLWLVFSPVLLPLWMIWQCFKLVRWIVHKRRQSRADQARRQADGEADAVRRASAARSDEARRRRNDLLFSCELFYNAHAAQLADRFSKAQLDDFVARYLQEGLPMDVLQSRIGQLMRLLRQHMEAAEPLSRKSSLRDLAKWYSRQKHEIEDLPVDETFREDYLVQLNERYAELCQQALQEVSP